jgi:inosine/guanosine/xanthosine phosphorylase family protein
MIELSRLDAVDAAAGSLARRVPEPPQVALVLGSGLGQLVQRLEGARAIPYEELEGMPSSGVAGHAGRLVVGSLAGTRVLVQQGRVHRYEGRSAREVTRAVRAFARIGVRGLLLTNAAGGLNRALTQGALMRIEDHLDLQGGESPLGRAERGAGTPYDAGLGAILDAAAAASGVALARGVYAGLLGPSYETPAEVRMLQRLGADAVGMSTVAEAVAGHAEGLRVAAVSVVTNPAAGLGAAPLSHEEVVAAGHAAAERFGRLLATAVGPLAEAL